MFVSRVIDARARAAPRRILEDRPRLAVMLVSIENGAQSPRSKDKTVGIRFYGRHATVLTLLVSKLFCCQSLSSFEMFDVFDETDLEFEPIGNGSDNFYGDAFNDSDNTTFGGDINTMDDAPPWHENVTKKFNFTDGNLNDDSNTERGLLNTTSADKLIINSITDDKHTNNTLANNDTAEISYGNADNRRPFNDATDFLSNDTKYHNGKASARQHSNGNDAVNMYNTSYYNDNAQNYDNASNKPFNNGVVFSNNRNKEIRAQIKNTTEFFTNNEAYKNYNADINGQPIDTVGFLYNNNINANIKGQFNNATELFYNKNTVHENDNPDIKTQLYDRTELSSNIARNQYGKEYSWTPFTPINNEVTNGTDSNAYTNITQFNKGNLPAFNIPASPFSCPEEEPPSNIGPYEVPTERDMILHMKNHLLAMYQSFHTRAMHFLKDVKEATQASWSRKIFCNGPTELMYYRRCVKWVADMSVLTTKSLVTALETIRLDVSTLIQGKICNISALSVDPVHLLRILAAEKVSLEFALPDFLRQLHACARHCPSVRRSLPEEYLKSAHLTDQDFVIRHYFTQQNYNQQLEQKYKY